MFKQLLIGLSIILTVTGCGMANTDKNPSNNNPAAGTPAPTAAPTPVTLTVFQNGAEMTDEDFQILIADPVKQRYPYIQLKIVRPAADVTLESQIAGGNVPDILLTPNSGINGLRQLDLLVDISAQIKKANINLNRFDPVTIDALKSDKGELWGLPYAMQFNALYYNKEIFNKFGKSYPKDGMTWDEAIELGQQLTRKEGTIQYRGLDPASSYVVSFPFSLAYVDAATNKASVDNEKWKQVFEMTKKILTIPGNAQPAAEPSAAAGGNLFIKEKNVAMLASTNLMAQIGSAAESVDWDIAQYPSFKEKPNISGKLDSHNLIVAKPTKHMDEAMKVLEVVTSDEVQLLSARKTARMSPLQKDEMKKQFGADVPYLKGKNVAALFKSTVSPSSQYSIYETNAKKIGQQKFRDYLADKLDLNTALRTADEEINKMISSVK